MLTKRLLWREMAYSIMTLSSLAERPWVWQYAKIISRIVRNSESEFVWVSNSNRVYLITSWERAESTWATSFWRMMFLSFSLSLGRWIINDVFVLKGSIATVSTTTPRCSTLVGNLFIKSNTSSDKVSPYEWWNSWKEASRTESTMRYTDLWQWFCS